MRLAACPYVFVSKAHTSPYVLLIHACIHSFIYINNSFFLLPLFFLRCRTRNLFHIVECIWCLRWHNLCKVNVKMQTDYWLSDAIESRILQRARRLFPTTQLAPSVFEQLICFYSLLFINRKKCSGPRTSLRWKVRVTHATQLISSFSFISLIFLLFGHISFPSTHFCSGVSSFKKLFKNANMNLESRKKSNITHCDTTLGEFHTQIIEDDERTNGTHLIFLATLKCYEIRHYHFTLYLRGTAVLWQTAAQYTRPK